MTPGLLISSPQRTVFPLSSVTAKYSWECGFFHANSRTVPVTETHLSWSYEIPVPWCPKVGIETRMRPMIVRDITTRALLLVCVLIQIPPERCRCLEQL